MPWPLENGGKIRTYHLIRSAARHAEIHLRLIEEPDMAPDTHQALESICASVGFFERSRPSPIERFRLAKLERWFHSDALDRAVQEELREGDYSLVHLDELLLTRLVPPSSTVPVVQHHHKLDTVLYDTLFSELGPKRHFDRWKLHRLEAESTRRYRHHLLCSQEDAELLRRRHGALDLGVVPSGFDPEHFKSSDPLPRRESDRIVFVGSMNYGPNVDAMGYFCDEVFPLLREKRPGLTLDIVGGNPLQKVKDLASQHVNVTGRVDSVAPYLESAGCMVVPLRIGGGTRLKIVEALATETPVVSTTIGAEGLGLEYGRHLGLADTPDAFATEVERILSDPEGARAMARAGHEYVYQRYRWDVLAEELVDYWERVAFSGTRAPSR